MLYGSGNTHFEIMNKNFPNYFIDTSCHEGFQKQGLDLSETQFPFVVITSISEMQTQNGTKIHICKADLI